MKCRSSAREFKHAYQYAEKGLSLFYELGDKLTQEVSVYLDTVKQVINK